MSHSPPPICLSIYLVLVRSNCTKIIRWFILMKYQTNLIKKWTQSKATWFGESQPTLHTMPTNCHVCNLCHFQHMGLISRDFVILFQFHGKFHNISLTLKKEKKEKDTWHSSLYGDYKYSVLCFWGLKWCHGAM